MPAFHEIRMPDKIKYGSSGGPSFSTVVIVADSGGEQRVAKWSNPRHMYNIGLDMNKIQTSALRNFFMARQGKLYGFRFKDWQDYECTDEAVTVYDTNKIQLVKTYGDASNTYTRKITKPVTGQVALKRNGVAYATFTIDYTTGIITLSGSTTGTFTWTGQFDVPVRFDVDQFNTKIDDFDTRTWDGLPLIELLL